MQDINGDPLTTFPGKPLARGGGGGRATPNCMGLPHTQQHVDSSSPWEANAAGASPVGRQSKGLLSEARTQTEISVTLSQDL